MTSWYDFHNRWLDLLEQYSKEFNHANPRYGEKYRGSEIGKWLILIKQEHLKHGRVPLEAGQCERLRLLGVRLPKKPPHPGAVPVPPSTKAKSPASSQKRGNQEPRPSPAPTSALTLALPRDVVEKKGEFLPWNRKIKILRNFVETNKTVEVPAGYRDPATNFQLGQWVQNLRKYKASLSANKVADLKNLAFNFCPVAGNHVGNQTSPAKITQRLPEQPPFREHQEPRNSVGDKEKGKAELMAQSQSFIRSPLNLARQGRSDKTPRSIQFSPFSSTQRPSSPKHPGFYIKKPEYQSISKKLVLDEAVGVAPVPREPANPATFTNAESETRAQLLTAQRLDFSGGRQHGSSKSLSPTNRVITVQSGHGRTNGANPSDRPTAPTRHEDPTGPPPSKKRPPHTQNGSVKSHVARTKGAHSHHAKPAIGREPPNRQNFGYKPNAPKAGGVLHKTGPSLHKPSTKPPSPKIHSATLGASAHSKEKGILQDTGGLSVKHTEPVQPAGSQKTISKTSKRSLTLGKKVTTHKICQPPPRSLQPCRTGLEAVGPTQSKSTGLGGGTKAKNSIHGSSVPDSVTSSLQRRLPDVPRVLKNSIQSSASATVSNLQSRLPNVSTNATGIKRKSLRDFRMLVVRMEGARRRKLDLQAVPESPLTPAAKRPHPKESAYIIDLIAQNSSPKPNDAQRSLKEKLAKAGHCSSMTSLDAPLYSPHSPLLPPPSQLPPPTTEPTAAEPPIPRGLKRPHDAGQETKRNASPRHKKRSLPLKKRRQRFCSPIAKRAKPVLETERPPVDPKEISCHIDHSLTTASDHAAIPMQAPLQLPLAFVENSELVRRLPEEEEEDGDRDDDDPKSVEPESDPDDPITMDRKSDQGDPKTSVEHESDRGDPKIRVDHEFDNEDPMILDHDRDLMATCSLDPDQNIVEQEDSSSESMVESEDEETSYRTGEPTRRRIKYCGKMRKVVVISFC